MLIQLHMPATKLLHLMLLSQIHHSPRISIAANNAHSKQSILINAIHIADGNNQSLRKSIGREAHDDATGIWIQAIKPE
jgi:hypothetical protein